MHKYTNLSKIYTGTKCRNAKFLKPDVIFMYILSTTLDKIN